MGSWNHTCAVSNLHVCCGNEVVVFMLAQNHTTRSFCYSNAHYDLCPIPFYGKYDDYGGVDECNGAGLNVVIDSIRSRLYEMGEGANQYHDCEVRKDSFDVAKLFEADHEDRLFVHDYSRSWNQDSYSLRQLEKKAEENPLTPSQQFELDRLANAISRSQDPRRRVTHVVVRADILKEILDNWYVEKYVGSGNGDHGYNKSYIREYFRDLEASIPELILRLRTAEEEFQSAVACGDERTIARRFIRGLNGVFEYNDPCLAGQYLSSMSSNSESQSWALVDVNSLVQDYQTKNDWEGLAVIAREMLLGYWINCFMAHTSKLWTRQASSSQETDPLGYTVLANATLKVLEKERAENGDEDEDDLSLEEITDDVTDVSGS